MMGVDSFLLSNDAGVALVREGVADKPPTSQRDLAATRPRSNEWAAQCGQPVDHISRLLAPQRRLRRRRPRDRRPQSARRRPRA